MRIVVTSAAIALAAFTAAGCSFSDERPSTDEGVTRVVAAFYPLAWLAEQEGGAEVEVRNLTPAGAEPHDVELRPSDIRDLQEADVVIFLGRGFQPAVEQALEGSDATKVDVLDIPGLELLDPPSGSDEDGAQLSIDPHVWLDPRRLKLIADHLADELGWDAVDVGEQLEALDASFAAGLAECERRDVFTSHAAFGYLTDRYDLRQQAITGLAPEGEPRPRDLERVAQRARERGATTIYFETLVSPKLSRQVAAEVGARTAVLDPLEGIQQELLDDGIDYIDVMGQNLDALRAGLECASQPPADS